MTLVYHHAAKAGFSILTAAEYAGFENNFLESKRKQLFENHPPSPDFKAWMKTLNNQKIAKPPIDE
jgi:predicted metallo-beta-lactamase superfamily hydrolase